MPKIFESIPYIHKILTIIIQNLQHNILIIHILVK